MHEIVTGKPVFGVDYQVEGMVIAAVMRPPAFGTKLKSFDDIEARKVNGVIDVITFDDNESRWTACN